MTTETRPLFEITHQAIKVLCKEIGVVDTLRFVGQFTAGYGNYTEEREDLFSGITLDEIVSQIKRRREARKTGPDA
jgi:hypothetical protein